MLSPPRIAGRSLYVWRKPFWSWRRAPGSDHPSARRLQGEAHSLQHETLARGDSYRADIAVALHKLPDSQFGATPSVPHTSSANGRNSNRRSKAGMQSQASRALTACEDGLLPLFGGGGGRRSEPLTSSTGGQRPVMTHLKGLHLTALRCKECVKL
jgi:hypothetical protein